MKSSVLGNAGFERIVVVSGVEIMKLNGSENQSLNEMVGLIINRNSDAGRREGTTAL
ncbi:MAG: hypothetical protein KDD67_16270 [Ignavibacteriae bacterium]|nr:hypothetical protein [Ignavibacteriota bacterium]MCB9216817.1 hypothetical protein [Ignavibacteria bacterium]